jgi:hypothetical protein
MLYSVFTHFQQLKTYCEVEQFKGWDPYDGLNSRIFQGLPLLRNNSFARLVWIQLFKKNPINLRRILCVDKGYNPKGLALFLNGYCHLYKTNPQVEYLEKINWLARKIILLKSEGYSGACWGYNFDWQAKAFLQPKYTPTVVVSAFVGYALLDAYEITGNPEYKEIALSISAFILKDLQRTQDLDGDFSFSYSPADRTQVFNASLLGSRMLARTYHYTRNEALLEPARKSVAFCCKHQKSDGSWPYGTLKFHQWIDNFHTGYNLECIYEYQKYSNDYSFQKNLNNGCEYYLKTFFTHEGIPKYYNNSVYPVDVHSSAQLIITLYRLDQLRENIDLVNKVLSWTCENMQHEKGYFYYQKKRNLTIKIPYMRWSQAWMFYALTAYLSAMNESWF